MDDAELTWYADGQRLSIGLDRLGSGPTVVLLPALSSMSTRREMRPLQERLAAHFATVAVDWPGFGDRAKPYLDWRPSLYEAFLEYVLTRVVPNPFAIVAAGHGAGYAIRHCAHRATAVERLVWLSPTWRGPLPTMMNGHRPWFRKAARLVDLSGIGPVFYRLNVNRFMVGVMARGHVYADPGWLHGSRLQEKLAVTRAVGARHGSVRFVTGALDPFADRASFLDAAGRIGTPMLNVFAETAPRKSRLEMEALAELARVHTIRLPRGKLSFYEEFPDATADAIRVFLTRGR